MKTKILRNTLNSESETKIYSLKTKKTKNENDSELLFSLSPFSSCFAYYFVDDLGLGYSLNVLTS